MAICEHRGRLMEGIRGWSLGSLFSCVLGTFAGATLHLLPLVMGPLALQLNVGRVRKVLWEMSVALCGHRDRCKERLRPRSVRPLFSYLDLDS